MSNLYIISRLVYAHTRSFSEVSRKLFSNFLVISWFDSVCILVAPGVNFRQNDKFIINYSSLATMYERYIKTHSVVTVYGAGKRTYHENILNKKKYFFFFQKYVYVGINKFIHCRKITVGQVGVNIFI